jgi:hypothetical protein
VVRDVHHQLTREWHPDRRVHSFAWLTGVIERLQVKVDALREAQPPEALPPEPESHSILLAPALPEQQLELPRASADNGSCMGINVTEQELARIPQAMAWYQEQHLVARMHALGYECKRPDVKIRREDEAAFMAVLALASTKVKTEGPAAYWLSHEFLRWIWTKACQRGYIKRPWNNSRASALGITARALGYCHIEDLTYKFDPDGLEKGKAMNWRLLDEFNFFLLGREREKGGIDSTGGLRVPSGLSDGFRPVRLPWGRDEWPDPPDYRLQEAQLDGVLVSARAFNDYDGPEAQMV